MVLESTNSARLFEILVTYFPFHSKKKRTEMKEDKKLNNYE
jgi:hypothetical protein